MKKLVALMLCALMVIPTFALAEEEKVLTILSWEGYVDSDPLAALEEETGIDVIWSPMDSKMCIRDSACACRWPACARCARLRPRRWYSS